MNAIQLLHDQLWIERLGWTLVHFLWQGAVIAAIYAALRNLPDSRVRYGIGLAGLIAMLAAPIVTWCVLATPAGIHQNVMVPDQTSDVSSTVVVPGVAAAPFHSLPTSAVPQWRDELMPVLVMLWFAGTVIFWLRLLGGWMITVRMTSTFVRPAPAEWQHTLEDLRLKIRVSAPVRLFVSAMVQVPTVVGWLRPVVLVPAGALTGMAPQHVEALLAHELAHIRRWDCLVNALQSFVEAMLFYHPAVWWVSGQIREERENCCDDLAAQIHGDRVDYATALASLEVQRHPSFIPAMAANGGSLRGRIARLLGQTPGELSSGGPLAATILLLIAACGLWAQVADTRPQFDVASIKANNSGTGVDRIKISGGSAIIENVSLQRIIGMAHGVPEGRSYLFSGPDWMDSANFDISAKYPADATNAQVMQMLQRVIEERFQLRLHREMKDFNAYAMVLTKDGPKFKASVRQGGAYRFSMRNGHAEGSAITMGLFGDRLSRPDFQLGRQVVDQTGLTGSFDLTFDFKPEGAESNATADGISASIFTALQEQLGLKLEARKIPLEVLVVDRSNKTPGGN